MKAAIIGGGHGCKAILELLVEGRLRELQLEVLCVVDPIAEGEGVRFAIEQGWPHFEKIQDALQLPGLELVLEVTGDDTVLQDIYDRLPPGVKVMDHTVARVFWDLAQVQRNLRGELHEREQISHRLQEILDSIPDLVIVLDKDMRIERVNARFTQATGLTLEEARAVNWYEELCAMGRPDELDAPFCPFWEVMKTGRPCVLVRYDEGTLGEAGHYEITTSPIFDAKGRIVRVVEMSRPITEQVQLKRATEESEQRFRQFVDAAHDLIVMKNLEGRYLVINPRAAELFGRKVEEFIGKTDREVVGPRTAKLMARKDREVIAGGTYKTCEESLVIDGRDVYLDTVRFPLFDYKGAVAGVASISRDITEHKRLERELIQSEKLAAVGKLSAGIAHELNNPLTGVLTFSEELLEDAPEDDPRREDYQVILQETLRCRRIVRDLLDYARMTKPERRSDDVNGVVHRALGLVARQAILQDIRFDLDLQPDLPPAHIDPNQIQQVLMNLVINAADAMDRTGRIRIETRAAPDAPSVEVTVTDTGCGIAEDKLQQIFEPFYSTKGAQGNGLGLPVVASIIEQHGGTLSVSSQVGVGTTFTVNLPCTGGDAS